MSRRTIAVTGASGLLGQRVLPMLDALGDVERVVGLDVRDPVRRVAKLSAHRVDIVSGDLVHLLADVDVVLHLASMRDPIPDADLMHRVDVDGTRRLLAAASAAGVRRIVRVSSAAVYGAWPDNPIPLTEDAPLRPSPGWLPAMHDAECERLLADWEEATPGAAAVVLRLAPVVGAGTLSLLARCAIGRPPIVVRVDSRPVQVLHLDDAASALVLAATSDVRGVFNVAADSWLEAADVEELVGRRHLPGVPPEIAERTLGALWSTGLGDAPPALVPYLVHPWVVANDRITAAGWAPRHTNEEAILLASPGPGGPSVGWLAASGAMLGGMVAATWWARRRHRRAA
jgi:nucleoside-diphosphate-sugar epimerase